MNKKRGHAFALTAFSLMCKSFLENSELLRRLTRTPTSRTRVGVEPDQPVFPAGLSSRSLGLQRSPEIPPRFASMFTDGDAEGGGPSLFSTPVVRSEEPRANEPSGVSVATQASVLEDSTRTGGYFLRRVPLRTARTRKRTRTRMQACIYLHDPYHTQAPASVARCSSPPTSSRL